MTEQKIREAFEQAKYEWEAHDDWRYADREACWLFFVRQGYLALLNELEPEMAVIDSDITTYTVEQLYRLPEGVNRD
jgi:hypothetical protein